MPNISEVGEHCYGCTACKHICPVRCISMEEDTKGFLYPIVDERRCIDCSLCLQVCPHLTVEGIGASLFPNTLVYGAKHREDATRMQSSSGGAFTAISDFVLEQGGVVYGAAYDEAMTVRHMRSPTVEKRNALRGSKYVQSDLGDVYKEVEQDLTQDRSVLFTGTPCQVAGLRNYLQEEYANLLLVDLVCYGVPSPKLFREYLDQVEKTEGKKVTSCTFRDTSKGWRTLGMYLGFGTTGIRVDSSQSSYYSLFIKGTILRPSCHTCAFSTFNRPGDITIGDFWGIEDTQPEFEDEKGVSLVLVNSEKGERAFAKIAPHLEYMQSTHSACLQPPFLEPTPSDKNRDAFWKEYEEHGYSHAAKKYALSVL